MKMRFLAFGLALLALSGSALANGGGYHYGVDFTGSIAPFTAEGTENVQIMDEKLDIILGDKAAKVSVTYQMKNVTDDRVKVKFGFPVEDVMNDWQDEQERRKISEPEYTTNYKVALNGKVLKHKFIVESFGSKKKAGLELFKGGEVLKDIEGWQVSEMSLKANETITLQITYDSQYDEEFNYVSEDSTAEAKVFKYRLSTGAVWHGSIKKGKVTVSYNKDLDPRHVRVEKPVNRFKKVGGVFVWEFTDLEPTLADDIVIQAKPEVSEYSLYGGTNGNVGYISLEDKWFLKHTKFSLKASSTLPDQGEHNYSADHLKELWQSKVWSEGVKGSGIGESITLTLTKPSKVAGISMMNGYSYKEDLFKQNNRVKTMELLINGKVKQLIHLPDTSAERRYFITYDKPISSIKMTIKEVYKGTKYDDTCLGFVGLMERLSKEPKTYGAR